MNILSEIEVLAEDAAEVITNPAVQALIPAQWRPFVLLGASVVQSIVGAKAASAVVPAPGEKGSSAS